ncbi:MAG: hypothetical protein FWH15_06665 [Betaproteobacteria bacterium]|nr:hypothetical protein [Betaproteobacteria bacterium]
MLTIDAAPDMPNAEPPVALVAQAENSVVRGDANPNASKDVGVRVPLIPTYRATMLTSMF